MVPDGVQVLVQPRITTETFALWSAKVPSKVKIFRWRLTCDNLVTKKNKFRRTLEMDNTCSLCGRKRVVFMQQ
jgi:hypothetical protein